MISHDYDSGLSHQSVSLSVIVVDQGGPSEGGSPLHEVPLLRRVKSDEGVEDRDPELKGSRVTIPSEHTLGKALGGLRLLKVVLSVECGRDSFLNIRGREFFEREKNRRRTRPHS